MNATMEKVREQAQSAADKQRAKDVAFDELVRECYAGEPAPENVLVQLEICGKSVDDLDEAVAAMEQRAALRQKYFTRHAIRAELQDITAEIELRDNELGALKRKFVEEQPGRLAKQALLIDQLGGAESCADELIGSCSDPTLLEQERLLAAEMTQALKEVDRLNVALEKTSGVGVDNNEKYNRERLAEVQARMREISAQQTAISLKKLEA